MARVSREKHRLPNSSSLKCDMCVCMRLFLQVSRFVRLDIDPKNVMWRRVVDINDR